MLHFRRLMQLTNLACMFLLQGTLCKITKLTLSSLWEGPQEPVPMRSTITLRIFFSKRRTTQGWQGGVCPICLLGFLFSFFQRNAICWLVCGSFHIIKEAKYPVKKWQLYHVKEKKKSEKYPLLFWTTVLLNTQRSPKKGFVVMLKSNCKLNYLNKKEGSGALGDSTRQTSG